MRILLLHCGMPREPLVVNGHSHLREAVAGMEDSQYNNGNSAHTERK